MKKIFISLTCLVILAVFSENVTAITVTWTGNGSGFFASDPLNWSGNTKPQYGDDVVFNSTSKDCTWDFDVTLASLSINSGYTGKVTLTSNLVIEKNFYLPNAPTGLSAAVISSSQINLSWTDNSNNETIFKIERKTGSGGTYSQIGTVGANVTTYSDNNGLLPGTTYNYRVKANNFVGDSAPSNEVPATTPPITITITSPLDTSTINRPDVVVKGPVTNTTGNETGVTVNGIVATVYNGQFFVNHVPLTEGSNTITVTATDTGGYTATTSIAVNANTTLPYITLNANIESGISPLTTYFSVSTSIPNTVTTYHMDYEGDSIIDYTGATFNNINHTYTTAGVYYPTVTVTDSQSNTYSDTIAIVVLNTTQMDALLRAKWNAMKNALANQNVNGALIEITEDSQEMFRYNFELMQSILPAIVQDMGNITLKALENNKAEYEMTVIQDGVERSYYIEFVVDSNGIWRINFF